MERHLKVVLYYTITETRSSMVSKMLIASTFNRSTSSQTCAASQGFFIFALLSLFSTLMMSSVFGLAIYTAFAIPARDMFWWLNYVNRLRMRLSSVDGRFKCGGTRGTRGVWAGVDVCGYDESVARDAVVRGNVYVERSFQGGWIINGGADPFSKIKLNKPR